MQYCLKSLCNSTNSKNFIISNAIKFQRILKGIDLFFKKQEKKIENVKIVVQPPPISNRLLLSTSSSINAEGPNLKGNSYYAYSFILYPNLFFIPPPTSIFRISMKNGSILSSSQISALLFNISLLQTIYLNIAACDINSQKSDEDVLKLIKKIDLVFEYSKWCFYHSPLLSVKIFVGEFLLEKLPFFYSKFMEMKKNNKSEKKVRRRSDIINDQKPKFNSVNKSENKIKETEKKKNDGNDVSPSPKGSSKIDKNNLFSKNNFSFKIIEKTVEFLIKVENNCNFGVVNNFFDYSFKLEEKKIKSLNIMRFINLQYDCLKVEHLLFYKEDQNFIASKNKFQSDFYCVNNIINWLKDNNSLFQKKDDIFIDYSSPVFLNVFLQKFKKKLANLPTKIFKKSNTSFTHSLLSIFMFLPSPSHPPVLHYMCYIFHVYPFALSNPILGSVRLI
jgi:hypothetical protein